jgi:hypothetical protein
LSDHDLPAHRGVLAKRGFDLTGLDPMAAQLDLAIEPAEKLEGAVF